MKFVSPSTTVISKAVMASAIMALLYCCLSLVACSGSTAASCDSSDDCFDDEACIEGFCEISDGDGGTGDTGDGDGGVEDNGTGDNGACAHSGICSPGVDEVDGINGYGLVPDDEKESQFFGCNLSPEERWFAGGTVETDEIRACPNSKQSIFVETRTCAAYGFIIEVELEPIDEQCPIDDFSEVEFGVTSTANECDWESEGGATSHCHTTEPLNHGGYLWTAYFEKVPQASQESYVRPGLSITADTGTSFPYRVIVNVPEPE